MKQEITLQFPSGESLRDFWNELSRAPRRVSLQSKTISHDLTEEEVDLAVIKYHAIVVPAKEDKIVR